MSHEPLAAGREVGGGVAAKDLEETGGLLRKYGWPETHFLPLSSIFVLFFGLLLAEP